MIPYSYKFVDFGGFDLSEAGGAVVDGIYQRIIDALNRCGELVLYNWYFASIPIAPSYCTVELRTDYLLVNEIIEVRADDTVWIESLIPPEPDPPVLVQLTATENGEYDPADYEADGFSSVSVEVPAAPSAIYTNTPAGVYEPFKFEVGASKQLAIIGNTTYVKTNSVPVTGAWCQSTLGYKAILVVCPVEGRTSDDVKFSPSGTSVNIREVNGVQYYYTWATGISGTVYDGPIPFSDVTGSDWTPILNALFPVVIEEITFATPVYKPDSTGYIAPPEGYNGFGPLYI